MQAGPHRCAWLSFPFFQSRAFKLIPLICYHVSAVFHHALVIQDQLEFNRPIVSAPQTTLVSQNVAISQHQVWREATSSVERV